MATDKVSKASVHFRTAMPGAKKHCGACSMFQPATASCSLVQGRIKSNDVCDRFQAKQSGNKY